MYRNYPNGNCLGGNYRDWGLPGWQIAVGGNYPCGSVRCCPRLGGEGMLVGLLFVDKKKIVKKIVKIKSSYGSIWGRIFLGFEKLSSLGIMWTQFTASVKPLEYHNSMLFRGLRDGNWNQTILIIFRLICNENMCHWVVKHIQFLICCYLIITR